MNNTAILRNIHNGFLYRHIQEDIYKNLATGVVGEILPDIAEKYLKINIDATSILNKNPNVELLITTLGLVIDK